MRLPGAPPLHFGFPDGPIECVPLGTRFVGSFTGKTKKGCGAGGHPPATAGGTAEANLFGRILRGNCGLNEGMGIAMSFVALVDRMALVDWMDLVDWVDGMALVDCVDGMGWVAVSVGIIAVDRRGLHA